MTIATWNIERTHTSTKRFAAIQDHLQKLDADLIILAEANVALDFGNGYTGYHSAPLDVPKVYYHADERRVSIYSKYPYIGTHETYRDNTAICYEFDTQLGPLAVYGTVVGILGNRAPDHDKNTFDDEVDKQVQDIKRIAALTNICIAGDLNMSFSDNYYHATSGRDKLNDCFRSMKLYNVTAAIPENIDHIVLPQSFVAGKKITTATWNDDKKLSDHKGVVVRIDEPQNV